VNADITEIRQGFSLTLTMDFPNLWKPCYRFTHACFHKVSSEVACRYQQGLSRLSLYCLPTCQMSAFSSHKRQNACYRNFKWTFEDFCRILLRNKDQHSNPLASFAKE